MKNWLLSNADDQGTTDRRAAVGVSAKHRPTSKPPLFQQEHYSSTTARVLSDLWPYAKIIFGLTTPHVMLSSLIRWNMSFAAGRLLYPFKFDAFPRFPCAPADAAGVLCSEPLSCSNAHADSSFCSSTSCLWRHK
jgi:hypothetical protein